MKPLSIGRAETTVKTRCKALVNLEIFDHRKHSQTGENDAETVQSEITVIDHTGRASAARDAGMILVVNRRNKDAQNLCQLIEFMDNSDVYATTPDDWLERLGSARLDALFVGADLRPTEIDSLLQQVGEVDPDVPIVMMHGDQE